LPNHQSFTIFAAEKKFHVNGSIQTSADVIIYDLTGRMLKQFQLSKGYEDILPAEDLKTGIYIIAIRCDTKIHSIKVLLR